MANTILIKTGTTKPTTENLMKGELGYDLSKRKLYIGQGTGLAPTLLTDRLTILQQIPQDGALEIGEIGFCTKNNRVYVGVNESGTVPEQIYYNLFVTSGRGSGNYLKGDNVTISADSKSGKTFSKWVVNSGQTIPGLNLLKATTSFPMPGFDFSITATYDEVQKNTHQLNLQNCQASIGGVSVTSAKAGDYIKATALPPSPQHVFSRWQVSDGVSLTTTTENVTFFYMIDRPITLSAIFIEPEKPEKVYHKVTMQGGNIVGLLPMTEKTYKVEVGTSVKISAEIPEGKKFSRWSSSPSILIYDDTSPLGSFTMPNYDIIITASFTQAPVVTKYQISCQNCRVISGATEAAAGSVVEIEAQPPTGQMFSRWQSSPSVQFSSNDSSKTSFVMPSSDITVSCICVFEEYSIQVSGGSASVYTAKPGEYVQLWATVRDDQDFLQWQLSDSAVSHGDLTQKNTYFYMGHQAITATATLADKPRYHVTVSGGTASPVNAYPGQTVTITADSKQGETFSEWTTTSNISFANSKHNKTTFVMPRQAVEIVANFTKDQPLSDDRWLLVAEKALNDVVDKNQQQNDIGYYRNNILTVDDQYGLVYSWTPQYLQDEEAKAFEPGQQYTLTVVARSLPGSTANLFMNLRHEGLMNYTDAEAGFEINSSSFQTYTIKSKPTRSVKGFCLGAKKSSSIIRAEIKSIKITPEPNWNNVLVPQKANLRMTPQAFSLASNQLVKALKLNLTDTDTTLKKMGVAADSKTVGDKILENKNYLNQHINNKENPHNVTAEQIGALDSVTFENRIGPIENHWTTTNFEPGKPIKVPYSHHGTGIDMQDTQLRNVDTIFFDDTCKDCEEGINFKNSGSSNYYDNLRAYHGELFFQPSCNPNDPYNNDYDSNIGQIQTVLHTGNIKQQLLDLVYPIGSIYISINDNSPASFLGGGWEPITGRFLLAAGKNEANNENYWGTMGAGAINTPLGEMAGEAYHLMTESEVAKHKHETAFCGNTWSDGNAYSACFGWGRRADAIGQTLEIYNVDGAKGAEGDECSYMTNTNSQGIAQELMKKMPPYLAVNMWKRIV